jgi:hypothetical protein
MGTNCAVELANIYVTKFVEYNPQMAQWKQMIRLWRRFIDDIFMVFRGTWQQFQAFLKWINAVHPSLRFTHNARRDSIEFLDVIAYRSQANTLHFKVFQKALNKYLYIPPQSNHPWSCKTGFIKGELMRYARISTLESHFQEMKSMFFIRLENRGYQPRVLGPLFAQVQHSSRYLETKLVQEKLVSLYQDIFGNTQDRNDEKKIMLKVPFHPLIKLLKLSSVVREFWWHLTIGTDTSPMVVYKRTRNYSTLFTTSAFQEQSQDAQIKRKRHILKGENVAENYKRRRRN